MHPLRLSRNSSCGRLSFRTIGEQQLSCGSRGASEMIFRQAQKKSHGVSECSGRQFLEFFLVLSNDQHPEPRHLEPFVQVAQCLAEAEGLWFFT